MPPQELRYRELRLCSGKGSYEAIPQRPVRLHLPRVKTQVEKMGRNVLDARVMLILEGPPETTVMQDGRVLIKTRDPETAHAELERLRPLLVASV
ncbi:MAG: hypothetical protein M1143_02680 [Candidatus Thermoplasmatota archaeon]|jgi:hypothetical protein|nr:hypothetical protein [Candidatus Thermoplasmatota archaeon]